MSKKLSKGRSPSRRRPGRTFFVRSARTPPHPPSCRRKACPVAERGRHPRQWAKSVTLTARKHSQHPPSSPRQAGLQASLADHDKTPFAARARPPNNSPVARTRRTVGWVSTGPSLAVQRSTPFRCVTQQHRVRTDVGSPVTALGCWVTLRDQDRAHKSTPWPMLTQPTVLCLGRSGRRDDVLCETVISCPRGEVVVLTARPKTKAAGVMRS
jgi:hypothetical protein